MEEIFSKIHELINRAENSSDPRVKDWPCVQYATTPILAICCYITLVIVGPKTMKNREAFQLRNTMALYNFLATLLSAYIFVKLVVGAVRADYRYICDPIDYSFESLEEVEIARIIWWCYMSKYFEMLDTIFFILRKKENQISFLHVYHHSSVLILWWITMKWMAGGTSFVPALINAFIHIVMYTYYGLSSFPSLRKYLWWKKYLTQLQMAQFCVLFTHSLYILLVQDCGFPRGMTTIFMVYQITLLVLFAKFYLGAYNIPKANKIEAKANGGYAKRIEANGTFEKLD